MMNERSVRYLLDAFMGMNGITDEDMEKAGYYTAERVGELQAKEADQLLAARADLAEMTEAADTFRRSLVEARDLRNQQCDPVDGFQCWDREYRGWCHCNKGIE